MRSFPNFSSPNENQLLLQIIDHKHRIKSSDKIKTFQIERFLPHFRWWSYICGLDNSCFSVSKATIELIVRYKFWLIRIMETSSDIFSWTQYIYKC